MPKPSGALAIVMLAAGLAAGFGAGRAWGPGVADVTPAPAAASRTPTEAPAAAHRPTPRAGASPPQTEAGVEALLAQTADPVPTGDGVIAGFVRDLDGRALAGVHVVAQLTEDVSDIAPREGESTLAFAVRCVVERHRRTEASRRETTTGDDGAFALEQLVEGPYDVAPTRDGWNFEPATSERYFATNPGERRDFTAIPLAAVELRVLLPDGSAPAQASIEFHPGAGTNERTWGPDAPRLSVPIGTYAVTATSGDGGVFRSEPVRVTVKADGARPVEIRLLARRGVRGRVRFASERHPSEFRVSAVSVDEDHVADPARLATAGHRTWPGDHEGDASLFSFLDLEPGTYLVGVTFRDGSVGATATVEVGDGLVENDLDVPDVDVHEDVLVRVLGPDGTPVADAFVQALVEIDGDEDSGESVRRSVDGAYRVRHHAPGWPNGNWCGTGRWGPEDAPTEVARVEHFVSARSSEFGATRTAYDPVKDRELTIRFAAPARLGLVFAGFDTRPYADKVEATVHQVDAEGNSLECVAYDVRPDARGRLAIGPVPPGDYEVGVMLTDPDRPASLGSRRLKLHAGDNAHVFELPELHGLVVATGSEASAGHVALVRRTAGGPSHEIEPVERSDDGRAVFRNVPAGRWLLVAGDGPEPGEMTVELAADATMRWAPRPFDALRTNLADDDYLRTLGIDDGDLVVAIDGEELANALQIDALLAVARTHERVRLTVLRGGRRFEVAGDGRRVVESGSLVKAVR